MSAQDVLDELQRAHKHNSWEDLLMLSKISNYSSHELYTKLKKFELRFVDDFVHASAPPGSDAPAEQTPHAGGGSAISPNYKTISKVQVEDIVFDDKTTPSLFGKIKSGSR